MQMPGRVFSSASYRYGFNGKENDNDVKGTGNQQDYGMRIYDPRLGKFLSVDPLAKEYSWNSTYAFAENDVIRSIDLDGMEKLIVTEHYDRFNNKTRTVFEGIRDIQTKEAVNMRMKSKKDIGLTTQDVYVVRKNHKGEIFFEGPGGTMNKRQEAIVSSAKREEGEQDDNLPEGTMQQKLVTKRGRFYESAFLNNEKNEFFNKVVLEPRPQVIVPNSLSTGLNNLFVLGITPILPGNLNNGTLDPNSAEPSILRQYNGLLDQLRRAGGARNATININFKIPDGLTSTEQNAFLQGVSNIRNKLITDFTSAGVRNVVVTENSGNNSIRINQ